MEDLTATNSQPDRDYNDRWWEIQVKPTPGRRRGKWSSPTRTGRPCQRHSAADLCMLAAENPDWPIADRGLAISWVQLHGDKLDDQEKPFLWLAEVVQKGDKIELRRAAALHMTALPKASARLTVFRSLLADEQDPVVIRHLKAAIKHDTDKK